MLDVEPRAQQCLALEKADLATGLKVGLALPWCPAEKVRAPTQLLDEFFPSVSESRRLSQAGRISAGWGQP